ncbi:MAG: hypothetical protein ACYC9S_08875 [Leptospirales bacterium]
MNLPPGKRNVDSQSPQSFISHLTSDAGEFGCPAMILLKKVGLCSGLGCERGARQWTSR